MKVIVKSPILNPGWNVGDGVEIEDLVWLKKLAAEGSVELLEPMPKETIKKAKKRK